MTTLESGADHLCPYGVPPPCWPPLWSYGLGIGILRCLASFSLQFGNGSLTTIFLGVLGVVALRLWRDCSHWSHHQDTAEVVTMGALLFLLGRRTHVKSKLVFTSHLLDVSALVRGDAIQQLCNKLKR